MKRNFYLLWFLIILLFLVFCVNYLILYKDQTIKNGDRYNLQRDGFCLYKNILTDAEINDLKTLCQNKQYKKTKETILSNPKLTALKNAATNYQYVFQDYIWIIQKSVIHTCHHDNNGDFFNKIQKHPSYTVLVYLEDMEKCLGVMP